MVQEVRIPFSNLNDIQFVQGFEDVVFDVPDLQDIATAVEENTLGRTQIDEAVAGVTDQLIEDIWTDIEVWSQVIDGIAAAVVTEFEEASGIDVPGGGSVIDTIIEETAATEDIDNAVQTAVSNELDNADLGPVDVNIEGIFGPLSEDLAAALADILNFDPEDVAGEVVSAVEQELGIDVPGDGPILDDVPTLEDIEASIQSELQTVCPELNGVNLCEDAMRFVNEVWNELSPRIADPEVIEELEQALEDAPEIEREEQ
jgi:hypothetical protein